MNKYIPPFTITNVMLDRVSSIMKKIGKLDNYKNLNKINTNQGKLELIYKIVEFVVKN